MAELPVGRFVESQAWDAVQCQMCPHLCSIAPSRQGQCGVRANRNGQLVLSTYGRVSEARLLPAEEIPIFHYYPGASWYRVSSIGCTMHCPFCNTFRISQAGGARTRAISPPDLAAEAKKAGARGIVFGGNEPAVSHEFVVDIATAARSQGLLTAVETSGMWSTEPFAQALELLDAVVFGLKGFNSVFVSDECGGLLEQTRLNIEKAVSMGRHVEITYLIVEDRTDAPEVLSAFSQWLADLSPTIAVHVIGCKAAYQWKNSEASAEKLSQVIQNLSQTLPFVYGDEDARGVTRDTRCPSCGRVVVARSLVRGVSFPGLNNGACSACGARIPILM